MGTGKKDFEVKTVNAGVEIVKVGVVGGLRGRSEVNGLGSGEVGEHFINTSPQQQSTFSVVKVHSQVSKFQFHHFIPSVL